MLPVVWSQTAKRNYASILEPFSEKSLDTAIKLDETTEKMVRQISAFPFSFPVTDIKQAAADVLSQSITPPCMRCGISLCTSFPIWTISWFGDATGEAPLPYHACGDWGSASNWLTPLFSSQTLLDLYQLLAVIKPVAVR